MTKQPKFAILTALCIACLIAACTKNKMTSDDLSCTSTLYGYSITDTFIYAPTTPAAFGTIDPATVSGTSSCSFSNTVYSNQATFNTSDNCYYVFRYGSSGATDTLFRIDASGTVSRLANVTAQHLEGLVYNQHTNKLYCLRYTSATPADIVEVTTSGTSFTVTPVGSTVNIAQSVSPVTSTVNNATGEIYFALMKYNPGQYSVEKFDPATGGSTLVVAGSDIHIMGLQFNRNDNMLYAVAESIDTSAPITYQFIKVSPGTGSITALSTLTFPVNNEFYSATLDPCNDRYILSTLTGPGWTTRNVSQFNMTGAVVQSDITPGLFQGLFAKY